MAMSTEQPVVTNQVPNPVMTNPNVNATNHSIVNDSTNQGAGGHPFILSGCGSNWRVVLVAVSVLPQMECQSIAVIIHWELNYHNVLIEFDGETDVE